MENENEKQILVDNKDDGEEKVKEEVDKKVDAKIEKKEEKAVVNKETMVFMKRGDYTVHVLIQEIKNMEAKDAK